MMTFDPMYCKCNKWSDQTYWEAKDGDGDANWGEVVLSVGATIGALHPVVRNISWKTIGAMHPVVGKKQVYNQS